MRLLFSSIFVLLLSATAFSAEDWEHWNDINFSHNFDKTKSLAFSNRMKFKDVPFRNIYIASGKLAFGYNTKFNLTITPSYRLDWIDRKAKDEYEHRYSLQFDYKHGIRDIKATVTQITELRYFTETTEDHVRLRLRLNLSKSMAVFADYPTAFYVMPEIFYDDISDEISRLRIYAGIDIKLPRYATMRIGYILQNEKDKPDVHLFNTGISASI